VEGEVRKRAESLGRTTREATEINKSKEESVAMKKGTVWTAVGAVSMLLVCASSWIDQAHAQTVFQAAGPTAASIQATVDAFRAALGNPNNGNNPTQASGRREINWDGGGSNATTTAPVTPFDVFLNTRGARFTTPGMGLSQATPAGLAELFANPTYADIFTTFSPLRLFTPVDSRITEGFFFVPGTNGATPATVTGFGAVFTDVDEPSGSKQDKHSTKIKYFDADGRLLFTGQVPSSTGDGSQSFFGLVFEAAQIARVRITSGNTAPGPDDDGKHDVVMMDDFIYGEPQALP